MKKFFLRRAPREKFLLLVFTGLALLIWLGRGVGRGRALWSGLRTARAELAAQQIWLENRAGIEKRAAAAAQSLDPAKTINATRLVGELNGLVSQAGLSADIGSQRTERTDRFAFHSVQLNVRRADLAALLKFYAALSQRSPYIGLEQFTLAVERDKPGQLNASFRVVSVELGQ